MIAKVNVAVLTMGLMGIRTAAQSIIISVDSILAIFEQSSGPTSSDEKTPAPARVETDPCKRGEHPSHFVRDARVMDDPTRRICRLCRKVFNQKEGAPDGHEAVSE